MKELLIRFVHKHIIRPSKYNYFFFRWLAGWLIDKDEYDDKIIAVGTWLYRNQTYSLPFSDIIYLGDNLYIVTTRPGLWIGKHGNTITRFADETNIGIENIWLIEDKFTAQPLIKNVFVAIKSM